MGAGEAEGEKEVIDTVTIRRVANGWVITPGMGFSTEFTHVATTPEGVADLVRGWAQAQIMFVTACPRNNDHSN